MASANTLFKSHEEFRRNKELEEARKAGIAPAAVDEEGREINPHIPQYMSSAPWYLNNNQPSLKHQKDWRAQAKDEVGKFYDRGVKVFQATTFRKGACENCGAISHKTKDCMERPRAKGAKWTNKHIAADEKVENIKLETFDARRDRWNGYDASEYSRVVDMYEKVDDAKRELRKKHELERRFQKDGEDGVASDDSDAEEDEDKIREAEEAGFGKLEKRVRTAGGGASGSVRNLRIREDTAKYLLNLDPSSAHYDPKSRSMREDPLPYKDEREKAFRGDNFVRHSGDYHQWEALTVHAHSAFDKGQDIHAMAAPSQAEALFQQFKSKKEALQGKSAASVVAKYGNAAAPASDEALLLGQSENYVEYNAQGRVVRGEAAAARSRYEEDVHPGNHTSVWGSWWDAGQWGYACCHQTVRAAYCTGAAGGEAAAEAAERMAANLAYKAAEAAAQPPPSTTAHLEGAKQAGGPAWGTDVDNELQLNEAKVKAAMAQQARQDREMELDERKRGYNSLRDAQEGITPEEMEAYRLKRCRAEDPMAKLASGQESGGYTLV